MPSVACVHVLYVCKVYVTLRERVLWASSSVVSSARSGSTTVALTYAVAQPEVIRVVTVLHMSTLSST